MKTMILEITKIVLDTEYQRGKQKNSDKIAKQFDEKALDEPLIGHRKDGSYNCVDGYQRLTALLSNNVKTTKCKVFESNGPAHEAEIFRKKNNLQTKNSPASMFKSGIIAENEQDVLLNEAVESTGFHIMVPGRGSTKDPQWLKCVNTLRRIQKSDNSGLEAIKFALNTIKVVWPNDTDARANHLIHGLTIWFECKVKDKVKINYDILYLKL